MELYWNGIDGQMNRETDRWTITARPTLSFAFDDVYYAPRSTFSFKLVSGQRHELVDAEIAEILMLLQASRMPATTLAQAVTKKLADLAAFRYDKETSGLTIGADTIRTDRESQAQLNGAYTGLKDGFSSTVSWKDASGNFVTINFAQISPIATAVFSHVQRCFLRENQLATTINALRTAGDVTAFDINAQW